MQHDASWRVLPFANGSQKIRKTPGMAGRGWRAGRCGANGTALGALVSPPK